MIKLSGRRTHFVEKKRKSGRKGKLLMKRKEKREGGGVAFHLAPFAEAAGVAFMSHWLTAAAAGWLLDSASLKLFLLVCIGDSHPTGRTSSRLLRLQLADQLVPSTMK